MRNRHIATTIVALACCCFARAADDFSQIENKIVSFKLDNGLTVILYPRGDAPVVSCVTYVKVGSTDEHVGITGIAHQLEHLAFKGTPNIGTNDYEAEKTAMGELDKLYGTIQKFEQKLPAEMRDPFLSLLAQVTTTGGPGGMKKIDGMVAKLIESWDKAGVKLTDDEKKEVATLVRTYAERVQDAEKFVNQNEYSNVIDRNGGTGLNAFTSDDQTVYHVSIPANKLELWAALETDRFMNIVPRQIEKEKQVVLEERRMRTDSSAFGKLYEQFIGTAFNAHPYGIAVIGHRSDILGYSREKIMNFYRKYYIPTNTTVCIVGDIEIEPTKKLLTQYFGKIPAAPEPEKLVTIEPQQEGERRIEVEFPAQPVMMLGYHVPERSHPDNPVLTVLDSIATSGQTSRLYSSLVKTKKANSIGSFIGPGDRYPRLFIFTAEPSEGVTSQQLEEMLFGEIEKLKIEPPTTDEMKRIVTRYRAGILRQLKGNLRLAQELADYQAISGDWRNLFRDIQQISAVTPEQVTAAAKKYFTKSNRTVGTIVPVPGETPGKRPVR